MSSRDGYKSISARALSALLRAHDGDVALLYLYLLSQPQAEAEQAAGALCLTLREVGAAWEKLQRMGLLPLDGAPLPPAENREALLPPAEELPQYSALEIHSRSRQDPAFSAVLEEAAQVLGRKLSGNDMRVLYGVYENLGLPPEVILELLNYVGATYRERYGESRRPSARALEKEAYHWANQELLTMEQAEAYIHSQRLRLSQVDRVRAVLGIRDRQLGATERGYVSAWLDMGFGEEAIAMALDRTLTNTGGLKWPYMNKILLSWHQQGLHEPTEIREKDGRGRKRAAPTPDKPMDLDALRRAVDSIVEQT